MRRLLAYAIALIVGCGVVAVLASIVTASGPLDFAIKLGGWTAIACIGIGIWRVRRTDAEKAEAEEARRQRRAEKIRGRA